MAIESKGDLRGGSSADEGSRVTNRAKTPAAAQVPFLLVSLWPKRILNKVFLEGRHYVGQGKEMLCPEMMYGMLGVVVLRYRYIFFTRPVRTVQNGGGDRPHVVLLHLVHAFCRRRWCIIRLAWLRT